jgi:hypothetical protein
MLLSSSSSQFLGLIWLLKTHWADLLGYVHLSSHTGHTQDHTPHRIGLNISIFYMIL